MHRRRTLSILGTALLAPGCLGSAPGNEPNSTDENGPNSTDDDGDTPEYASPPPGDCEDVERPEPGPPSEDAEDAIAPVSYPDPPDSLNDAAITDYVEAFERAYRRNALVEHYGDRLIEYMLGVHSVSTEDADGGTVALIEYNYSDTVEDTHSDGIVIGDSPIIRVGYHVGESGVWRVEDDEPAHEETALDPAAGDLVACFD